MKIESESKVPALERGLEILEYMQSYGSSVTVATLSDELDIPLASTNRLVQVLRSKGYLKKSDDGYTVHHAVCVLEAKGVRQILLEIVSEYLRLLSSACENTAIFYYWKKDKWECLDKVMTEDSLAMQPVGEIRTDVFSYPWSAYLDGMSSLEVVLTGLSSSEKAKFKSFVQARSPSGAVDNEGAGMRRISYPLYDPQGQFIGAFAMGGTSAVLNNATVKKALKIMKESTEEIKERLWE